MYNSQLRNAAVLRAFHDGMNISQAVTLKINHQMPVFRVLPFLCCFLLVNLQCKMLYCCMDFNFFLYFQHSDFQDHIFNTSLIFVHFLSSYSEICTALSTIFNLSFKIYCCKTMLLKTVSLFTTVLEFLSSCSCDAMTNLACFIFYFLSFYFLFNTINLLLIFHRNSQLYTEKDFNCCVSDF